MEDLSLDDILAVFRRRRVVFLLTFGAIFIAAVAFALTFSRYHATATVQIEQPYIAPSVTSVGPSQGDSSLGLADRRISQIQQKVTSTETLNKIAANLNLYPKFNKKVPPTTLAAIMRSKIKLYFISSDVANPAAVHKETVEQLSAIAFNVTFEYNDPKLTKQALDAIVKAFIDEEANQRLTQSKQTTEFLDDELTKLDATIKEQEARIAEFRAQYGESGPSATMFNQQASLTNAMNLQTVEQQLAAASANVAELKQQLAGVSPFTSVTEDGKPLATGGSQLQSLQSQYAMLTARYGQQHPDVVKVKSQIDAINSSTPENKLTTPKSFNADNPVYLQLQAQVSAAQAQYNSLAGQRAALRNQQAKFDSNIAKNPLVEKQMSQLTLDYESARERYSALKEKKLASEMQEKLATGQHSELLKVISPAAIPDSTNPKRSLIIIGGFLFALITGIAMVVLAEAFSQSVRGANHLASIVGVSPLVTVPHISLKA
ncbi:MAG: GumC family protein [Rickettsiales bacterium]